MIKEEVIVQKKDYEANPDILFDLLYNILDRYATEDSDEKTRKDSADAGCKYLHKTYEYKNKPDVMIIKYINEDIVYLIEDVEITIGIKEEE